MKTLPLTQGLFALVDDEDYDWLNQWKWYARQNRNAFYACRSSKRANGKRNQIQMHAEIIGRKEGFMTDHLNGDGLDNRRENLRHVTNRQNQQNQHVGRSSKHPGVCWDRRDGKWRAVIHIEGRQKPLGYFTTEQAAAEAYNKIANNI